MLFSLIKAWIYAFFAVMPPYFGFLFTAHLVGEIKKNFSNGLAIALSAFIGISVYIEYPIYIMIFLSIYGIILLAYFFFERYQVKIGEFDKGIIISLISIFLMIGIYYFNKEFIDTTLQSSQDIVVEFFSEKVGENATLIKEAMINSFNYILKTLFVYIYFTYIVTVVLVSRGKEVNWKLSYIHLLWYIGAFVLGRFTNINPIIMDNILGAMQSVYTIYGFKVIIDITKKKEGKKGNLIGVILGGFLYILLPVILFVMGSLGSFDLFNKNKLGGE